MTMTQQHAPSSHVAVPANRDDIEALSQLIADAFHSLNVSGWLIPDQAARREIFPRYFRMYVERAFADGLVHTTPDRAGVALWMPGSGPAGPPDGYAEQLAGITGPWVNRFQVFDAELGSHHPAGTGHHHLALLAVAPGWQNQGIGTALLDAHHAALDQLGVPAYLEASSERTRGIYLRHGYSDYGAPVVLPGGLPLTGGSPGEAPPAAFMYPMRRVPYPAGNGQGDD
jgi:GNAT superfamily N-acetyltransferase